MPNASTPDFTALYLPATEPGRDPSKSGFATVEAAWGFVYDRMCPTCREERARALAGEEDADAYPGCAAEWLVLPTTAASEAATLPDLLEAAGFERVPMDGPDGETPQAS